MATLESGLDASSNLPARPSIASARSYSSCLDLSPLPEDVHLEVYGNSLRDINSFHSVSEGMSPTRKTFPRQRNIAMRKSKQTSSTGTGTGTGTGDRPRTAPADMDKEEDKEDVAKNSGLRSARYLAMQWRSRSTQWNASSSMRSFSETSTLPSSPPPALKEQTSDSDSDSIGNLSVDESIISQVSEARSFIDNWKLRASMSQESDDDGGEAAVTDSLRSGETEKMSRNLRSAPDNIISRSGDGDGDGDEFHIEKTFGFATREKIDERDTIRENASTTAGPRSQSSKKSTGDRSVTTNIDSQRTIKSSGGIHPDRRNNSIPVIPSTATTSPQKELLRRQSPRSIIVPPATTQKTKQIAPPATTQKTKPTINHTTLEHQLKKAQSIQGLLEQLKKQGGSARQPKTKTTSRANEIKTPEPLKRTYPTPQKAPQKKIAIPEPTKTKPKPIKWDIYDFVFSFSLLTNEEKAPPPGDYIPDDEITSYKSKLIVRSKLLHDIMNQFAEALRKIRSLSNERGKFMMCPPDIVPNTKHVRRDESFSSPIDRQDTVRSFVRVSVPIFVPKGDEQAKTAAKAIVRCTFADAIKAGKFDGF